MYLSHVTKFCTYSLHRLKDFLFFYKTLSNYLLHARTALMTKVRADKQINKMLSKEDRIFVNVLSGEKNMVQRK